MELLVDKELKVRRNSLNHGLPIPGPILPVELCRRVPGAIRSVQQPAPAGVEAVQDPNGSAQRSRQVRGSGVDGNHEIEIFHQSRRSRKVIELASEVFEIRTVPMS